MREPTDGEDTPVVYHDGTVWFHLVDVDTGAVTPARGVCLVSEDHQPELNEPFPFPRVVSNDPTPVPTRHRTGRVLHALRWATPHDVFPH